MMYILLSAIVIVIAVQGYLIWNLLQKIKIYENSIEQFYSALTVTLATMRIIDSRQMFETDDEVGTVFQQLVDIVSNLRPILYGMETNEDKEN